MQVLKFGGSILRQQADFQAMLTVLRAASHSPTLVIVSALGSTTRELESCCRSSLQSYDSAQEQCEQLLRRTDELATELLGASEAMHEFREHLLSVQMQLLQLLRGVSITQQLTSRIRDKILSFGEHIALRLIHAYVNANGVAAAHVDAEHIIVSDSQHGNAQPLRRETHFNVARSLLPLFESEKLVIMQGFVARSQHGQTTTMGRESSNLSAALMAQLLHADVLTVYTNVHGIRSADPSLISNTSLVSQLSYAQAHELAAAGVKLLYPTMIEPLRAAQIPMRICHLHHPDAGATLVSSQASTQAIRVALLVNGLSLIQIRSRSLKANNQLVHEFVCGVVSHPAVQDVTRGASELSILCTTETVSEIIAGLPDDCTVHRHDGVDLIRLRHAQSFRVHSLLDLLARSANAESIVQINYGESDLSSSILCTSESSQSLYQELHDSVLAV